MRKQLHFLCTGNKIFVKYQAQGRFNPKAHPLAYALGKHCFFIEMLIHRYAYFYFTQSLFGYVKLLYPNVSFLLPFLDDIYFVPCIFRISGYHQDCNCFEPLNLCVSYSGVRKKIHGGVSFSGIWWSFVFGVRCL